MSHKGYLHLSLVAFFILFFCIPDVSNSTEDKTGVDVVLVMDSSGSMKKTDPQALRIPAARMFVSLLGRNDRTSVVSFSDKGYPIIHLTSTDSKENKDRLISAVGKISSKGAYTNLYDALVKGKEMVTEDQPDRRKIIIFMTDGMMDTGDKKEDERFSAMITDLLLKEFEKQKITVYTIAFSEYSDAKLLEGIAAMTGGAYNMTVSDKELHQIFASIFESAKKPEMLPIDENGMQVDKSIEELTIVASKNKPGDIVAIEMPGGKKITSKDKIEGVVWFTSPAFDMATVQKPAEGKWKIHFSAGANKAYIVSNMKFMTDFDAMHLPEGKDVAVKAWFEQDGSVLTKKEILETTEVSLELAQTVGEPLKTIFAKTAEDGILSSQFAPKSPGSYTLKLVARGKTFQRERSFKFDVKAPEHPQPVRNEIKKEAPVAKKQDASDEVSWRNVIVKFALFNVILAVVAYVLMRRSRPNSAANKDKQ